MKANPAENVKTGSDGERDTILEDALAYGRLFKTLDRMEAERRIRRPVADAIRVIALTGARRGEVAGMQWQHVDLRAGTVTLPPARHKTGAKTGKPRIIGLACRGAGHHRPPAGRSARRLRLRARPRRGAAQPHEAVERGPRRGRAARGHRPARAPALARVSHGDGGRAGRGDHDGARAPEHGDRQKYVHAAQDARQRIAEKAAATALAGMAAAGSDEGGDVVPLKGGA